MCKAAPRVHTHGARHAIRSARRVLVQVARSRRCSRGPVKPEEFTSSTTAVINPFAAANRCATFSLTLPGHRYRRGSRLRDRSQHAFYNTLPHYVGRPLFTTGRRPGAGVRRFSRAPRAGKPVLRDNCRRRPVCEAVPFVDDSGWYPIWSQTGLQQSSRASCIPVWQFVG